MIIFIIIVAISIILTISILCLHRYYHHHYHHYHCRHNRDMITVKRWTLLSTSWTTSSRSSLCSFCICRCLNSILKFLSRYWVFLNQHRRAGSLVGHTQNGWTNWIPLTVSKPQERSPSTGRRVTRIWTYHAYQIYGWNRARVCALL